MAEHPLFEGLTSPHVDALAECAVEVRMDAGALIFREGQTADHLYLLTEGTVALEAFRLDGGPTTIQTLDPGDSFGWSWLVPPYRWRFDARALTHVRVIKLDGERLREMCETTPSLGCELLKRLAKILDQRLQAIRLHLPGLASPTT